MKTIRQDLRFHSANRFDHPSPLSEDRCIDRERAFQFLVAGKPPDGAEQRELPGKEVVEKVAESAISSSISNSDEQGELGPGECFALSLDISCCSIANEGGLCNPFENLRI